MDYGEDAGVLLKCYRHCLHICDTKAKSYLTEAQILYYTHRYTNPFNGPFPGLPRSAGTRKIKPIWILPAQEIVSGSGISWARGKSAPRSRQITTPAPHYSVFFTGGCPSCHPTNSVKALKANAVLTTVI